MGKRLDTIIFLTIIVSFIYICVTLFQYDEPQVNLSYINERYYKVTEDYEKNKKITDNKSYKIILKKDETYEKELYKAYKNNDFVMEFEPNKSTRGTVIWFNNHEKFKKFKEELIKKVLIMWTIISGLFVSVYFFINKGILQQYNEIQQYTGEIAKLNLDIKLPRHKYNYFGKVTEGFDIMREELKKAKQKEYEANVAKKELVAELSHDIKTPISTIKAVTELLLIKEDDPKKLEKLQTIEKKSDTINELINNLFHATLEELEELEVNPELVDSRKLSYFLEELRIFGTIEEENQVTECLIYMDELRMEQVITNIIYNSYKYANTVVKVKYEENETELVMTIRDFGKGVSEEELPLLTQKYYRGSNARNSKDTGAGLGMYLVKYFMEKQNGGVEIYCDKGFVVVLHIKKQLRNS
ncbi:sensor histidine kinase [Lachnobacterium bovis]|uniref:sensor histidine kinase n=1 Tax=Lachnobacterium bovis TaxID=140626 RepID=UPI0003B37398|nr:HAMP domain-containing sensor histidine kinase [Lachnobacterium bovis]